MIDTLAEGTVVGLRIDEVDTVYDPDGTTRWWPVRTDAGDGWVAGFYLQVVGLPDGAEAPADADGGPTAPEGLPAEPPAEPRAELLGGSTARVAEPDGVNLRAQPGTGSDSLASLAFDRVVELRIDEADTVYTEGSRWWPVRVDGQAGWIAGSYLAPDYGQSTWDPAAAEAPEVIEAPAAADGSGSYFAPGSYVAALTDDGTGLNIRADAAPDAERVGSVPEKDVVQVMDGPFFDPTGTGWYLITDGEVTGFVIGSWLVEAGQPTPPDGDPESGPGPLDLPSVTDLIGVATGSFIYPVSDFIFTQAYGCSPYWFEPWEPAIGCNFHNGIDLAGPYYTPITAADGGIVEYAGWCDCGLGYYVKIDHGNGFKTVYGHMAEQPWVATGQAVSQGEVIGPMGSTGNSTGPHVHFIVEINGITDDPLAYLG